MMKLIAAVAPPHHHFPQSASPLQQHRMMMPLIPPRPSSTPTSFLRRSFATKTLIPPHPPRSPATEGPPPSPATVGMGVSGPAPTTIYCLRNGEVVKLPLSSLPPLSYPPCRTIYPKYMTKAFPAMKGAAKASDENETYEKEKQERRRALMSSLESSKKKVEDFLKEKRRPMKIEPAADKKQAGVQKGSTTMMQQQQQPTYQQQAPYQQQPYAVVGGGAGGQRSPNEVRSLWIGDLQFWMDENYLSSCFPHTGELVGVKVIRNKLTQQSEGYGFLEFRSRAAAEQILQSYNGTPMVNSEQTFRLNWASMDAGERSNRPMKIEPAADKAILQDLGPSPLFPAMEGPTKAIREGLVTGACKKLIKVICWWFGS